MARGMPSPKTHAFKGRTHKERAQPASRRKYGLLEKHKDRVVRSKNFHKKEKAIKILQAKAENRNPDEFYFAMEKARTREGVHQGRLTEANKYSQEELRLLKTQDFKYLLYKAQVEDKKVRKLSSSLHFIGVHPPRGSDGAGASTSSRHTVFVDSAEEAARFEAARYFDTHEALVGRAFNRPRAAQLASGSLLQGAPAPAAPASAGRGVHRRSGAAYKQLLQRKQRHTKLHGLAVHKAYEKEIMGKGRKTKIEGKKDGRLPIYRWKQKRKK